MDPSERVDEPSPMSRFGDRSSCTPRIHGNSFTLTSSKESKTRFYVLGQPNNYRSRRRDANVPPRHIAQGSFVINNGPHPQDLHRHMTGSAPNNVSRPSSYANPDPEAAAPPRPEPEPREASDDDNNPMYGHALLLASVSAMAHTQAKACKDNTGTSVSSNERGNADQTDVGEKKTGQDLCKTPENSPPRKKDAYATNQQVTPSPRSQPNDSPKTPRNAELFGLFNAAYERNERCAASGVKFVEKRTIRRANVPHLSRGGGRRSSIEGRGTVTPSFQEEHEHMHRLRHPSPVSYRNSYRRLPVYPREDHEGPPYSRSRYCTPMKESPQWAWTRDDCNRFGSHYDAPDFHETDHCPQQPILASPYEYHEPRSSDRRRPQEVLPRRPYEESYYIGYPDPPPQWNRPSRHEVQPQSWEYACPHHGEPDPYYCEHYQRRPPRQGHWREPAPPHPGAAQTWRYGPKQMPSSIEPTPPPRVRFTHDISLASPREARQFQSSQRSPTSRPKVEKYVVAGAPQPRIPDRPRLGLKAMVTPDPSKSTPRPTFKGSKTCANKPTNSADPTGKIIISKGKWAWKDYPELEAFLIANRDEYLRHSAMNYTSQQKEFNNRLTERLLEVADRHNYVFDRGDFNFVSIRDRIRCYYKSYVQSNKKRGIIVSYPPAPRKKHAASGPWVNASVSAANSE